MIELIISYLPLIGTLTLAGLVAGVLAGLFGIGGGAILVPVFFYLFDALGFADQAMHVATSTSLATIIATSIRSVAAHHRREAVDWAILKSWSPWIVLGAGLGMLVASGLSGHALTIFFGVMALGMSAQFIFGRPGWSVSEEMPDGVARAGLGGGVGCLSAMLGIGGGTFGVTLMSLCGQPIHRAIGTAAGFGLAISLPAALVALSTGLGVDGRPPGSVGYVNLPAAIIVSLLTVTMAPVGARLAHATDPNRLKQLFGLLLAAVALNMLWGAGQA